MKEILFIYNPEAGRSIFKRKLKKTSLYLKDNNYDYDEYVVRKDTSLVELVTSLASTYKTFIVAGGDGTVHSVIAGVMLLPKDKRPKILILPFGSANDYAKMLGMKKNLKDNLALLATDSYKFVDIYKINESYFLYAAALGKFANVSYAYPRQNLRYFGKLAYLFNALRSLFKKEPFLLKISANGQDYKIENALLVLVSSGPCIAGFNLPIFSSGLKLNDESFKIKVFTRNHFLSWFKIILFYFGGGRNLKHDLEIKTSEVSFSTEEEKYWNIDGEKGPKGGVNITVLHEEIAFFVREDKTNQLLF